VADSVYRKGEIKMEKHRTGSFALGIARKYFPSVNKIKDSKASIDILVTKEDDRISKKKSHAGCAMAVACKRRFKLDGVIISKSKAYLIKGRTAIRFQLPESVSREVVSFDRGGGFSPGKYKLSRPAPAERLGNMSYKKDGNHTKGNSKTRKTLSRHVTTRVRTDLNRN
jgi:hypothetical protein